MKLTPATATLTSTWPGPGDGRSTSMTCRTSAEPDEGTRTARTENSCPTGKPVGGLPGGRSPPLGEHRSWSTLRARPGARPRYRSRGRPRDLRVPARTSRPDARTPVTRKSAHRLGAVRVPSGRRSLPKSAEAEQPYDEGIEGGAGRGVG